MIMQLKKPSSSPCNEKDLALLAVLRGNKIKVKYSISAIIFRQGCGEIIITLSRASSFFNHNFFLFLINFKNHIAMNFLPLQFQECAYAMLSNTHARRCISLHWRYILVTWIPAIRKHNVRQNFIYWENNCFFSSKCVCKKICQIWQHVPTMACLRETSEFSIGWCKDRNP